MTLFGLTPAEYMTLDLTAQPPQDLKDLAYYLWCCFEDDESLMAWREKVLLPFVQMACPIGASLEEEEADD